MDTIQSDLNRLVKTLYQISSDAKGETRRILEVAARPIIEAARSNAPVGTDTHFRYSTPKVNNNLRAPNGMGVRVAEYKPGNLRDSIKGIFFRRAKNSIYVGPVLSRRPKGVFGPDYPFVYDGGTFSSTRTDGYYARWVEFGVPELGIAPQPFMRPAAASSGGTALSVAVKELDRAVQRFARKYAQAKGR